jgi:hypothetical protein
VLPYVVSADHLFQHQLTEATAAYDSRPTTSSPRSTRRRSGIDEPRRRVARLQPQPLDELRRRDERLRKLLSLSLAQRRREGIDLPNGRPSVPEPGESHGVQ